MKTSPGIKTYAIIVLFALLIPISINWYSFLARTFTDENETPDTSLEYTVLTDSNSTFVEIPKSVNSIGIYAFEGCSYLNVVIDNSKDKVKLGKDAFKGCKSVRYTK